MAQENYNAPSIITSGATFTDLKNGGVAGVLSQLITANAAFLDPASQATVNVTAGGSTGGLLPAGVYFVSYTYGDGAGESLVGTSESASFTASSGNKPRVTFNDTAPTGAVYRNVYLTKAGGAAGTEVLYITGIAVGTATVDLLFAAPIDAGVKPPTVNTTGAASIIARLDAGIANNLDLLHQRLSDLVRSYVEGTPVDFQAHRALIRHIDYVWAMYKQLTKEVLTLITANPGTLGGAAGGAMHKTVRTFS